MTYLVSIAAVLILCVFLFFSFGRTTYARSGGRQIVITVAQQSPQAARKLTREEITKQLQKLKVSPPPKKLSPGAMCYEVSERPDRTEYICPLCGERTLYSTDRQGGYSQDVLKAVDIPTCRGIVKSMTQLDLRLDEREFCRKCRPGVANPSLTLIIKYPGEQCPRLIKGITVTDLEILSEFLSGKDRHEGTQGIETPLSDYIPRLQEMLGVKAK